MALTTTYGTLITQAKNLLKSTCNNVDSNFANIPAQYKSGYSATNVNNALTCVTTISSNAVVQVAGTTVESDFTTYMNNCGISAISSNTVTINGILTFLNCFSCFCQARCVIYSSQYTTTNIVVYKTGTVTYPTAPSNGTNTNLITAIDEGNYLQVLGTILNNSMKCEASRYTRTLTWTGT